MNTTITNSKPLFIGLFYDLFQYVNEITRYSDSLLELLFTSNVSLIQ